MKKKEFKFKREQKNTVNHGFNQTRLAKQSIKGRLSINSYEFIVL